MGSKDDVVGYFLQANAVVPKRDGVIGSNHAFPWLAIGARGEQVFARKTFVPDKRFPHGFNAQTLRQIADACVEGLVPPVRQTVAVKAKLHREATQVGGQG